MARSIVVAAAVLAWTLGEASYEREDVQRAFGTQGAALETLDSGEA